MTIYQSLPQKGESLSLDTARTLRPTSEERTAVNCEIPAEMGRYRNAIAYSRRTLTPVQSLSEAPLGTWVSQIIEFHPSICWDNRGRK